MTVDDPLNVAYNFKLQFQGHCLKVMDYLWLRAIEFHPNVEVNFDYVHTACVFFDEKRGEEPKAFQEYASLEFIPP